MAEKVAMKVGQRYLKGKLAGKQGKQGKQANPAQAVSLPVTKSAPT